MNNSLASRAVVGVVRLYQRFISPLTGPRCRFFPSCSEYCMQAAQQRGVLVGLGLAGLRIIRCQPLNPGGFDPVPPI
jgi:putative membrane protein insertion efficiency factor